MLVLIKKEGMLCALLQLVQPYHVLAIQRELAFLLLQVWETVVMELALTAQ